MSDTTADIPVLNIEEGVKVIWEIELSRLVSAVYGRPYQLQQQGDMMGQESMMRINVPSDLQFDGDTEAFDAWRNADATRPEDPSERFSWDLSWKREENGLHCPLEPVVNDLHAKGLLPEGRYIIHVWW